MTAKSFENLEETGKGATKRKYVLAFLTDMQYNSKGGIVHNLLNTPFNSPQPMAVKQ